MTVILAQVPFEHLDDDVEVRFDGLDGKLRLLSQQELHRALHLLRRHRLKFHDNPSVSAGSRHYAIVLSDDEHAMFGMIRATSCSRGR
jgi:hypothetical protein